MDTGSRTKSKPQGPIAEIAPTSHCCQYIPGKVCVCVCVRRCQVCKACC